MSKTVVIGTVVVVVGIFAVNGFLLWRVGLNQISSTPTEQQTVKQTHRPPYSTSPSQDIDGEELTFQKVSLAIDLVLKEAFESYPTSRGLLQTEAEFQIIWAFMENWRTRSRVKNPNIDFTQYSVIWYATKRDASFVEVEKVEEFSDFVEVKVVIIQSDFLTRELFLWTIPKTTKEIRFIERMEFYPI